MDPRLLAYRFATDNGPFNTQLFDGYLHGYADGLADDRRWITACDMRNDYEKAVWCGFYDARMAGTSD